MVNPSSEAPPRGNESLSLPLALVSVPTGFGEITLLGEWSERLAGDRKNPVVRVSPDGSDKVLATGTEAP